ncbi:LD-carboxypeptidase [Rhodoferax sp.]|uniref:LD-carboxypeptidase n=1 Tax=Rhodoferax sp. TaxID=50421 RepID=UPI002ACEDEED|nr:LD-carboxypeptidase [Rhodoferax sp.]MDZ7919748.1 LD-carboxypeptidase [Rhodoferax sp.]
MKKHIYIYSPSGAVRDKAAFRRGVKRLQVLGYDVELDADALNGYMRFAGDDSTRLAAIHRAAASGADIALISRGGYGITRLLADIRYRAVSKAVDQGMQFVGISDFTAFQLAVLAKTGTVTWAGPALCEGFGVGGASDEQPDDIMEDCFHDMASGQGEGTGWRQNQALLGGPLGIQNAMVWGGNLSVLVSMVGTPYFPSVKGGILFLEDIGEHPYQIERMLTQLLHSGILSRQKAVVLGQFTGFTLHAHDKGFKLSTVVAWLQAKLKIPVLTNLPYGHVQTKVLLPVGKRADLVAEGRDVMLVWGH